MAVEIVSSFIPNEWRLGSGNGIGNLMRV